ncbi:MAG TPA: DUF262 domain-containing protein [Gemmatimonas sp.]|uniref:DUF262 domain-containing protein n=1 Tax=Gemmatimonas sp. TaxID=1962908 RepID=UPI002EDAC6E4
MTQIKPTKTVYTVSDFLDWQRNGTLQLKPIFQRREVWGPKAKSLLIDTVVKGLPVPIVFLRKTQDLNTLSSRLEVVDGQQRLRTLFAFVDSQVLADYAAEKDAFTVLPMHNNDIANRTFRSLDADLQAAILDYEISTHVLPPNTSDEVVLRIFSRLNSTGSKLNKQELRNAEYFGEFKTLSYDLAIRNLPLWRRWGVFDDDDFARMVEVESVSDYLSAMMDGIQGKSQPKLDALYEQYDDELPGAAQLATRFQHVMDAIDDAVGEYIADTRLQRQALFYSLFTACYDHVYGLGSDYRARKAARALPSALAAALRKVNERISSGKLPDSVADAMDKATADKGRRDTRHKFFMRSLGLASAT